MRPRRPVNVRSQGCTCEDQHMRIEINMETCLNSGQCAYMQPDLFEVDDDGVPTVLASGELTADQLDAANDAVDVCPSQSITLVGPQAS